MSLVDRLVEIMGNITKITLLCPVKPVDDILMQLRMVGFEGEDIIGFPLNHGLSDVFLTVEGINGDNTAFDEQ